MKKISINSSVQNGILATNRKYIADVIKTFDGANIIITIEKRKKKRSNNQNSYYWSVIIPCMQDGFTNVFGEYFSIQECHEALKGRFLYKELINEENGEVIRMPKSTTELTTIEMELYHDQIRLFGTEFLGINIPLPDSQIEIDF
jgi:predicted phage tail protein